MKRCLAVCVAVLTALAAGGCTRDYEEIARADYQLDRGYYVSDYDYIYGLSQLKDAIDGIYDDDDAITELGRDVVAPLVEFDDALAIEGAPYSFPTRMFYYVATDYKSYEKGTSPFASSPEEATAVFWNSLSPDSDKTIAEGVMQKAREYVIHCMAAMYAYEDYGLELTDDYLSSYENVFSFFGNTAALNEYFAAYGLNDELLKEYYKYSYQYSLLHEYLVGTGGLLYPDDDEAYAFFESDCLYLQQIVFSYVVEDENGCIVYKTDEEIAASRAEGQELYAKIVNDPEQFIRNMYRTEHLTWKDNPTGYVYVPGDVLEVISDAYFAMMPDEIIAVDTPIGYYIIRALEKNKQIYESSEDMIIRAYCDEAFESEMSKYYSRFTVNEAEFSRYEFSKILT